MTTNTQISRQLRRVRICIAIFIVGLVISGATAIPLEWELRVLLQLVDVVFGESAKSGALYFWLSRVHNALHEIGQQHPFVFYGFDWLAFGHFAIAIVFIGPWRDPVQNRWVLHFGIIASLLVIPYALVFGHFRGIPLLWRIIDCSFGLFALPLLIVADRATVQIQRLRQNEINGL